MRSADDLTTTARIRDAAIRQFGEHGFGTTVRAIAAEAGVSAGLVIHHFGSKDALRKACDDYIAEQIHGAKAETIQSSDPGTWLAQVAEIDEYAPMMAYLVRSMQAGGDLAKSFWTKMLENTEDFLEVGVRAGTIKPSRDPKARARFLGILSGGGFLLYLQLHHNPSDVRAVLRDYAEDMMLPALELYTDGLMTDSTIYDAFRADHDRTHPPDGGARR